MPTYPELEISLHQRDTHSYGVTLRFGRPGDEAEQVIEASAVRFDEDQLRASELDPQKYGQLLSDALFADPRIRSGFAAARTATQGDEQRLRVRLCIDRWSTPLHALRWETLRDPETGQSLLMDSRLWFSRSLASFHMRPVRLRSCTNPRTELRALLAIANPSDLGDYEPQGRTLAAVQVADERAAALEALNPIVPTQLGDDRPVTLDALLAHLQNDHDILYLVCHGALMAGEARVWLQDEQGRARVTSGTDIADGLARLVRLPRLVVLSSCQSAGTGQEVHSDDRGVLAALGPRLAEVGVPAVIAMQGNVNQQTARRFLNAFFRELLRDGQIDRAMTEARFAVRDAPDYWAPVLFTRLVNGRLWYDRRLAAAPGFDAWEGLLNGVRRERCVPILGSGLLEPFVGSTRDLARRWAERYRFPFGASFHEQLPQIAQFLSTTQGPDYPRDLFVDELTAEVCRRWPDVATAPPPPGAEEPLQRLARLLSVARRLAAQKNPAEPHAFLARLPCRLYVTTNSDTLLEDALGDAGKPPQVEQCHWREQDEGLAQAADSAAGRGTRPTTTVQQPLVYRLFGDLADSNSLVLTEDDYFNYLINVVRQHRRPLPSTGRDLLSRSFLMFLGFRIDDWDFRVFFKLLMSQQGVSQLAGKPHVAVQFDPEDGRASDPSRARRYLERYLQQAQISIFWGSVEEFVQEFNNQWQRPT
jgi:hypothetical protein